MRRAIAIAFVFASASVASADVITEPQCTHGWIPAYAGHSVSCAPVTCLTDAQCGGGHCVEVARCMRTQPMDTGRMMPAPGEPTPTYEAATETLCAADGSCAAGTHCTHARECTEPPPPHHGMCSIAEAPSSLAPTVLVALAVLTRVRRRASRRSPAGRPGRW